MTVQITSIKNLFESKMIWVENNALNLSNAKSQE